MPPASTISTLLFGVVIVAALYFGREVLVPIALAILMSFVLAPLVRFLHGWRVPRSVAVIFVVLVAFAAIFAIGAVMLAQVNRLAGKPTALSVDLARKDTVPARRDWWWERHARKGGGSSGRPGRGVEKPREHRQAPHRQSSRRRAGRTNPC